MLIIIPNIMDAPIQALSQIISTANVCYIVRDSKTEEAENVQPQVKEQNFLFYYFQKIRQLLAWPNDLF